MKQSYLFLNKKSLLSIMMLVALCFSVNAKKKPQPFFKYNFEVKTQPSKRGGMIVFRGEVSNWNDNWAIFQLRNNTDQRIYIEWENARVNGYRVIFNDDRRITMGNPKADEAVSAHGLSIERNITSERNIRSNYISPLFYTSSLKKNIGTKSTVDIMIPIRYMDNSIEEFEMILSVWYELPSTTE